MGAALSKQADRVSVRISGKFGFDSWRTLRSARNAALDSGLQLSLDLESCSHVDMAGLGALMIAQQTVRDVRLHRCGTHLLACFAALGICDRCAARGDARADCPRNAAVETPRSVRRPA